MDRRQFMIGAGGLGLLASTGSAAFGQAAAAKLPDYYPQDYGKIIEGSKAEKNLLIYSNMSVDMWAGVMARYKALYPWMDVQTLDLESSEVIERFLAERGTGSKTADLLATVAPDSWINAVQRNELVDYKSPEIPYVPAWSLPYPGLYTIAIDPMLFIWNKMLLPENMVPKGFQDLAEKCKANPAIFKGKMSCYGAQFGSFGYTSAYSFIKHHGEKGWEWLDTVGPMTRVERSSGPMVEKTLTGEYVFGYLTGSGNPWLAVRNAQRAKVLGWSFISDGTPVMMRGSAIPKSSNSPNAAKLWLDVMISHQGQIGMAKGGRTPYRLDVSPEEVDGAYTYQTVIKAIGEKNVIPVNYNPDMITDHDAFLKRWMQAYKL
ncbi:ABC transporter substrate-binding protein [Starkeya sp. ORNL1]|uniref:ABC transporter substrate-binding protein n=1 Tax=Starkeya sp. ORNL1 TaxID=2709380 RepID=UPI0014639CEE|nr:ABC transporter substrate-binding protein [Starkeya sp. ORNL1]QJP14133.1 ABC transporter substrate-binding protein [Starkeya sp. ORNL1]